MEGLIFGILRYIIIRIQLEWMEREEGCEIRDRLA